MIKERLPQPVYNQYRKIRYKLDKYLKREKKKKYGNRNGDLTFYVIRRDPPGAGLLSNYTVVLYHIQYAIKKGWIPIVDMINYPTNYNEKDSIVGTKNPWEYYWEQPCKYTLEEVYQSKNVVLSSLFVPQGYGEYFSKKSMLEQNHIVELNGLTQRIPFNQITEEYLHNVYQKILGGKNNVLGVAVRGTDYRKAGRKSNFQPTTEEMVDWVETLKEEWKASYIFLTTEEVETLQVFKDRFGENLLFLERPRFKDYNPKTDKAVPELSFGRKNDKYQTGLEYLCEMYLLSKCDMFIGSRNNGTNFAIIMNNNTYSKMKIIGE